MNKKQQQAEQTKKKITDAARALFAQKGYKATSIEDLVKATGCSAGNIYYHFKNKEGLFLYLLEDWNREWDSKWLAKEKQYPSTIEKLYGVTEFLALDQLSHPLTKAADEFFNNSEKAADVEERINEMVQGYIAFNRRLLMEGVEKNEFHLTDVDGLAVILDALLLGLNQHSRRMDQEKALSAYRLAMNVFLHGIVKPKD